MKKQGAAFYKSDIGILEIKGTDEGINSIEFFQGIAGPLIDEDGEAFFTNGLKNGSDLPVCVSECIRQLDEYFRGVRTQFDLKLNVMGTDFQKKVWEQLGSIPFGHTATYAQIAVAAGNDKACRAVGNANNKNNMPIIIPCHRVVGSNGKLTGYAGGLWRKEWLLAHEKKTASVK